MRSEATLNKTARRAASQPDRCDLCGYSSKTPGDRFRHLRKSHPSYWRGLLLRFAAPMVFMVLVFASTTLRSPGWGFAIALAVSLALMILGQRSSREARRSAGLSASAPIRQLMKEGGLRIILLASVLGVMLYILSRQS